jgi:hypothetical protein
MQNLKVNASKGRVFIVTEDDERLVAEVHKVGRKSAKKVAAEIIASLRDQNESPAVLAYKQIASCA